MMDMRVTESKPDFEKVIEHLEHELTSLRTGRAHPALLDSVQVEAYGAMMDIKSVGSITVTDARTLLIEPWDKTLLKALEKGIVIANIGINPVVDGNVVRLSMPKLTEENRRELVKVMLRKLEEGRVALRAVREKVRNGILDAEKSGEMGEDERYAAQEDLEKLTASYVEQIKQIGEAKEAEIMTV